MIAAIFGAGGQLGLALSATKESGVEVHMFRHQDVDITSVADLSYAIEYARPDVIINAERIRSLKRLSQIQKKLSLLMVLRPVLSRESVKFLAFGWYRCPQTMFSTVSLIGPTFQMMPPIR